MAYYGDRLYTWTKGDAANPVAMGLTVENDELDFLAKTLDEIASANALDEDEIEALAYAATVAEGTQAIAQSSWIGRRAVAIVSLLERISPARGQFAARVVREAYIYLANPGARKEIDDIVRPRIGSGELVIVSHSLGTVVAFNLLRELASAGADVQIPLLVTLGSPLGLHEVKKQVGGAFAIPRNVTRWMNFYDKGDPVTLGRALATSFAAGIVDTVVDNNTDNAHSIAGYLDDKQLIDILAAVL
ncbi:hypothetical protein ASF22_21615 [Methylobacterium sp. Leaf87]|nr:hypothetical protein ASF22_21615 [Methylobacterium sp. Leaf87]